MQISMTPGMYHNSRPLPVVFGDKMRLKSCFRCNSFSAYRAAPFLVVPNFNEFFSSFGAVQHSFPVTFLIISRPFFIEWVASAVIFLNRMILVFAAYSSLRYFSSKSLPRKAGSAANVHVRLSIWCQYLLAIHFLPFRLCLRQAHFHRHSKSCVTNPKYPQNYIAVVVDPTANHRI